MLADEAKVGVAIALQDGLAAPAILERDAADVRSVAHALEDLLSRARAMKLRRPEMTDATFTLSNLGKFGVTSFIPIVTPPQVAILGVGATTRVRRYNADEIVPGSVMTVTVSADHRAVDGADVARFTETFRTAIECPEHLDG